MDALCVTGMLKSMGNASMLYRWIRVYPSLILETAPHATPRIHVVTERAAARAATVVMAQRTVVLGVCQTVMRQLSVVNMLLRPVKHVLSTFAAVSTDL